ncbi:MAG: c-type cytochrome [Solirubrobacterales bacterium]
MRRASLFMLAALAACDQNMVVQQKSMPTEASALFPDGKVDQAPPPGTVARDQPARDAILANRPPLTRALLERGRERYAIYCQPCHSPAGDGDGIIPRHGFPHPPSYLEDRLRRAPASHFVQVMTNGHGIMFAYGDRVPVEDRWAIAAWIRALQEAQAP